MGGFLFSWTSKYLEKLVWKSPSYNYYNTKNSQCCRCSRIYVNLTFYVRNAKIARISHVFSRLTYYFFKHCTKTQDQLRYHLDNHLKTEGIYIHLSQSDSARNSKCIAETMTKCFGCNLCMYFSMYHINVLRLIIMLMMGGSLQIFRNCKAATKLLFRFWNCLVVSRLLF